MTDVNKTERKYNVDVFAFDPRNMTAEQSGEIAKDVFPAAEELGEQLFQRGVRRIEFHETENGTVLFIGMAKKRDQSPGEILYRMVSERLGNLEWALLSDYQRGRWEEIANAFKQCV